MTLVSQSDFARALLDPDCTVPVGVTSFNGSDPVQRFAIYRNNVIVSLIDAMAAKFVVTQALVGEEFFRAMAGLFVRQSPPKARQMADYGADFPAFIAGFAPAQSIAYLADMARLEHMRIEVYHARDARPLALEYLAAMKTELLPQATLKFIPALRLLISDYAVASMWAAHQDVFDLETIDPDQPEAMLIARPDMDVVIIPATIPAVQFAAELHKGAPLGDAAMSVLQTHPDFNPAQALQLILQSGIAESIELPEQAS